MAYANLREFVTMGNVIVVLLPFLMKISHGSIMGTVTHYVLAFSSSLRSQRFRGLFRLFEAFSFLNRAKIGMSLKNGRSGEGDSLRKQPTFREVAT